MLNLPASTWVRFIVWMALGFIVYFGYSQRHSRMRLDAGGSYVNGGPGTKRQPDTADANGGRQV
jgi:APA family basic amino acid/polyamine antiporter